MSNRLAETVSIDSSCRACGVQCAISPDPPGRAVCPEHCEDHEYVYIQGGREKRCVHCDAPQPEDWR